jgi:hypothetical protein
MLMAEPVSVYDASTASGHGVPPVAKYSYKLDAPLAGYTYELRENNLTQRSLRLGSWVSAMDSIWPCSGMGRSKIRWQGVRIDERKP